MTMPWQKQLIEHLRLSLFTNNLLIPALNYNMSEWIMSIDGISLGNMENLGINPRLITV